MELFFQWLIDRFESLYCTFIVRPYQRGVHIRRGHLKRVAQPGLRLKQPFGIDEIEKVDLRLRTSNLPTQVVERKAGHATAVGVVVWWCVREDMVERLILDVEGEFTDVFNDTVTGMVAEAFDNEEISFQEARKIILESCRRRLGRYGFVIKDIYLTDFGPARIFRLVQSD